MSHISKRKVMHKTSSLTDDGFPLKRHRKGGKPQYVPKDFLAHIKGEQAAWTVMRRIQREGPMVIRPRLEVERAYNAQTCDGMRIYLALPADLREIVDYWFAWEHPIEEEVWRPARELYSPPPLAVIDDDGDELKPVCQCGYPWALCLCTELPKNIVEPWKEELRVLRLYCSGISFITRAKMRLLMYEYNVL